MDAAPLFLRPLETEEARTLRIELAHARRNESECRRIAGKAFEEVQRLKDFILAIRDDLDKGCLQKARDSIADEFKTALGGS